MSVEFHMKFRSGNAAVVNDPAGAIVHAMDQVRAKLDMVICNGIHIPIRDANGNRIGEAWIDYGDPEPEEAA